MLWIGILPALAVVWVRKYVKEPEVWLENRRKQREQKREVHAPLFAIFKPRFIGNTLTGVLVDGELLRHLLLDLGAVRDAPAEGPRPGVADGRPAAGRWPT